LKIVELRFPRRISLFKELKNKHKKVSKYCDNGFCIVTKSKEVAMNICNIHIVVSSFQNQLILKNKIKFLKKIKNKTV